MLLTNGKTYVRIFKNDRGIPQGLSDWYVPDYVPVFVFSVL